MMQVIPQWKVEVILSDGSTHTLWVTDNFASNVLRKVADMSFAENGLIQPVKITIGG